MVRHKLQDRFRGVMRVMSLSLHLSNRVRARDTPLALKTSSGWRRGWIFTTRRWCVSLDFGRMSRVEQRR
jgi:hypothetical protein